MFELADDMRKAIATKKHVWRSIPVTGQTIQAVVASPLSITRA
jgi:hypothetical protein